MPGTGGKVPPGRRDLRETHQLAGAGRFEHGLREIPDGQRDRRGSEIWCLTRKQIKKRGVRVRFGFKIGDRARRIPEALLVRS